MSNYSKERQIDFMKRTEILNKVPEEERSFIKWDRGKKQWIKTFPQHIFPKDRIEIREPNDDPVFFINDDGEKTLFKVFIVKEYPRKIKVKGGIYWMIEIENPYEIFSAYFGIDHGVEVRCFSCNEKGRLDLSLGEELVFDDSVWFNYEVGLWQCVHCYKELAKYL